MKQQTNGLRDPLAPLIKVLTNKYFLVLLVAVIWMLYFDRYNWVHFQSGLKEEIHQLQADEQMYQEKIRSVDHEREIIFSDTEELERVAREKHHMKKSNEDVYISVKD